MPVRRAATQPALALLLLVWASATAGGASRNDDDESSPTKPEHQRALRGVRGGIMSTLVECMSMPSYMRIGPNGTTAGQCLPSSSPGAYYSTNASLQWQCWNDHTALSVRTEEAAKAQGYDGVCAFADYGKRVDPEDVPLCGHVPTDCNPGYVRFWGACYSNTSEQWSCILKPEKAEDEEAAEQYIHDVAQGDCKALPTSYNNTQFYDGVCRFPQVNRTLFKCDTLDTYSLSSSLTCGNSVEGFAYACFSSTPGVPWQCFRRALENPSCVDTPTPDGENYDGACAFPSAGDNYTNATDARVQKQSLKLPGLHLAAHYATSGAQIGIECMSLPSYMRLGPNGATAGQCLPSSSPGAYYSTNASLQWQCWNDHTAQSVRTEAAAKAQGFDGVCTFANYGKDVDPEDVPLCEHVPTDCNPGYVRFWGACYSNTSKQWSCILKPEEAEDKEAAEQYIHDVAQGDCKALPTSYNHTQFYDGVCRFPQVNRTLFKCDTLDTYSPSSSLTCGNSLEGFAYACFSSTPGVPWQCFRHALENPSCVDTPTPVGENYNGACAFPSAGNNYTDATDAGA